MKSWGPFASLNLPSSLAHTIWVGYLSSTLSFELPLDYLELHSTTWSFLKKTLYSLWTTSSRLETTLSFELPVNSLELPLDSLELPLVSL